MKDIVYVEHKHYVSVKNRSIRFVDVVNKEERYMLLDDVEILIFDHIDSYFSSRLVNACMEQNIPILFCDKTHSPQTELVPDFKHVQKLKRLKKQMALSQKVKNRLWRKIVIAKIHNQANCLILEAKKEDEGSFIKLMSKQVTEGDKSNREAYAANRYFVSLFGGEFKRGRYKDPINSGLNYGYALLRALIKRECAIHGLEMSLGIHHESTENPFNLSDDIIEPYRPFVDALVYENIAKLHSIEFTDYIKKELLKVFLEKCVIDNKVYYLTDAIKKTVSSLVACLEEGTTKHLLLPSYIEVGK